MSGLKYNSKRRSKLLGLSFLRVGTKAIAPYGHSGLKGFVKGIYLYWVYAPFLTHRPRHLSIWAWLLRGLGVK